jgi:hypothetical protein
MFGGKIDNHITMLQRMVALTRDLVIAAVAALTSAIIYYGGEPAKLNALDWARLVVSAFFIVVGPVIAFFVIKAFSSLLYAFSTFVCSTILPDSPMPKGPFAWIAFSIFRIPRREYVRRIRKAQNDTKAVSQRFPRLYKIFLYWPLRAMDSLYAFQRRANPYLFAALVLLIAVLVFRDTLGSYLPYPSNTPNPTAPADRKAPLPGR